MDKQEELIKRLRNANSDFGIDDDLTKEAADEIEELQHALEKANGILLNNHNRRLR